MAVSVATMVPVTGLRRKFSPASLVTRIWSATGQRSSGRGWRGGAARGGRVGSVIAEVPGQVSAAAGPRAPGPVRRGHKAQGGLVRAGARAAGGAVETYPAAGQLSRCAAADG